MENRHDTAMIMLHERHSRYAIALTVVRDSSIGKRYARGRVEGEKGIDEDDADGEITESLDVDGCGDNEVVASGVIQALS